MPEQGEKILLKVNLLVGDAPEKCVNTHPSVLRAVAEILKAGGAQALLRRFAGHGHRARREPKNRDGRGGR